ncbi:MAG: xanthine dehydrogenase family protein subunit M [Actinomycetales bacterium]|nr:xanthine dehydrogenase family protein subunit M [Actinomycetales bacterium]
MPDGSTEQRVLAGPAVGAAEFTYHRPGSPQEVDDLLAQHRGVARVLAGGTDLLVQIRSAARRPAHVIDIADLSAVRGVSFDGGRLRVGAATQLWEIEAHPVVRKRFAALREAVRCVGSLQIQNRATLVGNVCNASPAADTGPALLVYDAQVGVRSVRGNREVGLAEFWLGPGQTALEPDEWVEHVTLQDQGRHGSAYVKLGRTRGVDLALVGVAALARRGGVRLACASLAPTIRRLAAVEDLLSGDESPGEEQVAEAVGADVSPISDLRASARYRLAMTGVCIRRANETAGRRWEERNA